MRTTVVAAAALGAVVSGVGLAQPASAAPGDCLATGPEVTILDETYRGIECEPYPVHDPSDPYPTYSVCTDLPAVGGLPRKTCTVYRTSDDSVFRPPQVYTYPPENNAPDYNPAPYTPSNYQPPAPAPAPAARPTTDRSTPSPATQVVEAAPLPPAPVPGPTTSGTAERSTTPAPGGDDGPVDAAGAGTASPDAPAAAPSLADQIDQWAPWVAVAAAFILGLALAWRPKRRVE